MSPARCVPALLLVLACAVLAGCLPSRIVLDLAPGDGELGETVVIRDPGAAGSGPKVAMIDVSGVISHTPAPGLLSSSANSVDSLVARLAKAEEDPQVRAVLLRINSPGGTVAASETMYEEIRRFRERTGKPVVVSMAEVAASGGYYIALAADRVIAQQSTITGSIGVIVQTINFSRGLSRIGIESRAVTSGPNKDLASPLRPEREAHFAILQSNVDEFYNAFRALVVERRAGVSESQIDELTDGRILTGRQAHESGLVDALGGVREGFEQAKQLAEIGSARLVKYHAEGRTPRSPYSTHATTGAEAAPVGTQVNLFQLNLAEPFVPSAGFYYLWAPALGD